MRRLTRDEYLQSAQAVFGSAIVNAAAVQQAAAQIPAETTGDITREFQNAHAFDHVEGIFRTALQLAAAVIADAPTRDRLLGKCAPEADQACARAFLEQGALRILKRPLEATRRDALLGQFTEAKEKLPGMQVMLASVLQAPEAVFHLELPRDPEPAHQQQQQVDDWTVASRVAYALTGRGPDEPLLQAAARGELRSESQVRPHAIRLLQSPDARRQLEAILDAWLDLHALPTPTQTIATAAGIDPAGLADEARRELLDYALYETFDRDADARTLLTANVGFPRSKRLAKLYGVTQSDEPVSLPNGHAGLLLRVAPMLSGQHRTSPIMRGVFVRRHLLCDELASPDFSVVQARTTALEQADPKEHSTREISEAITAAESCMSCHADINPVGYTLEAFDPLGQARKVEVAYTLSGVRVAEHSIDTTVDNLLLDDDKPEQLDDASDLVEALAQSAKYPACLAQRLYTHAQLRAATDADSCGISRVETVLRDGGSVKDAWLVAAVNPDTFLRAGADEMK
jgi:hypothetical protein